MADGVDRLLNARAVFGPQADRAPAVEMPLENLTVQHMRGAAEHDSRAGLELLPGMHERIPTSFAEIGKQKAFDGPAARHARAEQPGRKHFRVVDDEEIASRRNSGRSADACVFDLTRAFMQHEQPRRAALGRRRLRDQVGGQIEIEIRNVHPTHCPPIA